MANHCPEGFPAAIPKPTASLSLLSRPTNEGVRLKKRGRKERRKGGRETERKRERKKERKGKRKKMKKKLCTVMKWTSGTGGRLGDANQPITSV